MISKIIKNIFQTKKTYTVRGTYVNENNMEKLEKLQVSAHNYHEAQKKAKKIYEYYYPFMKNKIHFN